MTCQIELDPDCGDIAEFSTQNLVTARKEHKCAECGRTISPGEKYEYVTGRWNDYFQVYKTCADCLSIRDTLFCNFYFGCIYEELRAEIDNTNGGNHIAENLSGLTPAARTKVSEMLEEHWAEMSEEAHLAEMAE